MLMLSGWQVQRGLTQQALTIHQTSTSSLASQPVSLKDLLASPQNYTDQHLRLLNSLSLERVFLVNGQIKQGRPGFEVFLATQAKALPAAILVGIGWRPTRSEALALAQQSSQQNSWQGYLTAPKGGLWAKHPEQTTPNIVDLAYMDLSMINQSSHQPLLPLVLYTPASTLGQLINQPGYFQQRVLKHFGYAMQFFCFACLAFWYFWRFSRR